MPYPFLHVSFSPNLNFQIEGQDIELSESSDGGGFGRLRNR